MYYYHCQQRHRRPVMQVNPGIPRPQEGIIYQFQAPASPVALPMGQHQPEDEAGHRLEKRQQQHDNKQNVVSHPLFHLGKSLVFQQLFFSFNLLYVRYILADLQRSEVFAPFTPYGEITYVDFTSLKVNPELGEVLFPAFQVG